MTETSLQKLEKEVVGFPDQASRIIVCDDKTLKGANDFVVAIKKMRKEVADTFNPIIEKAHKAHKEALAQKKKYEAPLIEAEKTIKLQIASYMSELERKRREAEEAAKKAEEERQRLEEENLKKAKTLEAAGYYEDAENLKSEIPTPAPIDIPSSPKLEGTSISKIVKWRIKDFSQIPRDYLMIDSAKITKAVKASKGEIRIPGIEVYTEDSVRVKT